MNMAVTERPQEVQQRLAGSHEPGSPARRLRLGTWHHGGPAGDGPGRSHQGGRLRTPGPDRVHAQPLPECPRSVQAPLRERQARTAALGERAQGRERCLKVGICRQPSPAPSVPGIGEDASRKAGVQPGLQTWHPDFTDRRVPGRWRAGKARGGRMPQSTAPPTDRPCSGKQLAVLINKCHKKSIKCWPSVRGPHGVG